MKQMVLFFDGYAEGDRGRPEPLLTGGVSSAS